MSSKYESLKKLFFKSGKSDEEILSTIKEKEQELRKNKPNLSEQDLMKELANRLYNMNKAVITDRTSEDWIILNLWASDSFNWVKKRWDKIMEAVKNNPHKAVADGMCEIKDWTPDNKPKTVIPLYYWEKSKRTGLPNKMKGKPLPEVSMLRTAGGIALRISQSGIGFKLMQMTISGDYADSKKPDIYKPIIFGKFLNVRAGFEKDSGNTYHLKATASTHFTDENTEYEFNNPEQIESIYSENYISIKDVEKIFPTLIDDEREHAVYASRVCVSKCVVTTIIPATGDNSDRIAVDSPLVFNENGEIDLEQSRLYDDAGNALPSYICWWNNTIPLDFGVGSVIYLFYKMSQKEEQDIDKNFTGKWGNIQFSVLGCFVVDRKEKEVREIKEDTQVSGETFIPPDIDDVNKGVINQNRGNEVNPSVENVQKDSAEGIDF